MSCNNFFERGSSCEHECECNRCAREREHECECNRCAREREQESERREPECGCKCNYSYIVEACKNNIGRIVTIFTASGGLSGCGFTGIVVSADCNCIKLITELPTAPRYPLGNHLGNSHRSGKCCNNRCCCGNNGNSDSNGSYNPFGTVVMIPVCQIVSFVFNEL